METQSTGSRSIAFMSSTQTKTVSATGPTNLFGSPWKMPRALFSISRKMISTNACFLLGTPVVEPLAIQ